jgi:DNA-binding transcriptional regulator YiaG
VTCPPGYTRARATRNRVTDALWHALRAARAPISTAELADRAGSSHTQAKRLVQAARDAGWIVVVDYATAGPGDGRTALYALTTEAPEAVGTLRRDGSSMVAIGPSTVTGAELAVLRQTLGWSAGKVGDALGVERRTVRRYERTASLPPVIAEKVADLAAREP